LYRIKTIPRRTKCWYMKWWR